MTPYVSDRLWRESVVVEGHGRVLRVQSTRDALLCLKNHWPVPHGAAAARAVLTCERGLESDDDPAHARRAFLEAAEEAGFTINSWTTA